MAIDEIFQKEIVMMTTKRACYCCLFNFLCRNLEVLCSRKKLRTACRSGWPMGLVSLHYTRWQCNTLKKLFQKQDLKTERLCSRSRRERTPRCLFEKMMEQFKIMMNDRSPELFCFIFERIYL